MINFSKLSISYKISLGYVIIIFLAVATSIVTVSTLQSNRNIDQSLTKLYIPAVNIAKDLKVLSAEFKKLSNNWIFMPNPEEKERMKTIIAKDYPELKKQITDYLNNEDMDLSIKESLTKEGIDEFNQLIVSNNKIMETLADDESYGNDSLVDIGINIYEKDVKVPSKKLSDNLDKFIEGINKKINLAQEQKANSFSILTILMILSVVIIIIVSLTFSFFTGSNVTKPIINLKEVVAKLGQGEVSTTDSKLTGRNDEIGEMAKAMQNMITGLVSKSEFASEIGKGNYDKDFHLLSQNDSMGVALLQMRDNLKINAENERRRNWATNGIAQLGELLRNIDIKEEELFQELIKFIIKYTKSNQGGVFILNDENPIDPFMELVSCYAYDRQKFLTKRINIGEGLVGQCYLEKDTIYMTEVPDDYVTITSGLGTANPNAILIVPLKLNDKILGVLEIASFKCYEPYEIELIEKYAESIASSVSSVKINSQTKKLLIESQMKEEQLRSQEEEMRQNMEELQATQEEMQRKEEAYLEEIRNLRLQLETVQS